MWRLPWLFVVFLSFATMCLLLLHAPPWLNAPFVVVFCLVTPGLTVALFLGLSDPLLSAVVVLTTGPAAWTLIATAQVFFGFWSPTVSITVVAALTAVLSLFGLHRLSGREQQA